MHSILIALGTNVHSDNIRLAEERLAREFNDAAFSKSITTLPLGEKFQGRNFINAVASCTTRRSKREVVEMLKQIEAECGDTRARREAGEVVVDIDLLLYDKEKCHVPDWQRQYIKDLIQDLLLSK